MAELGLDSFHSIENQYSTSVSIYIQIKFFLTSFKIPCIAILSNT